MDECAATKLEVRLTPSKIGRRLFVDTTENIWILDCWWPFSASGLVLYTTYKKEGVRALCHV